MLLPAAGEAAPERYRHHVIFLVDTSGSAYKNGGRDTLNRVLREELGPILDDDARNGFLSGLYDPSLDLSSYMGFGLSRDHPFFQPRSDDRGFLRVRWVQEEGHSYEDLADRLPTTERNWTAFATAFGAAVRQLRFELDTREIEPQAFERTFLVMVTDAETNTTKDSVAEILQIHGAAAKDRKHLLPDLAADRKEANAHFQLLTSYYSIRPPEEFELLAGVSVGWYDRFKVFVRELKPHQLDAIDSLLTERPGRTTELARHPGGFYASPLSLAPKIFGPDAVLRYELLKAEFQKPGSQSFQEITGWGTAPDGTIRIALPEVELPRAAVANSAAHIRLSFVRRDPVYGQSIQRFEDTIRFRAEPTDKILGLLPVFDWMVGLTPGLSQGQIAALFSWIAFFLLLLLLAFLSAPHPKANLKLLAPASGGSRHSAPIPVDFNLADKEELDSYPIVLRTLHFANEAGRLPRLRGQDVRFERKFDVDVSVRFDAPESVDRQADKTALGISAGLNPTQALRNLSHNSEQVVVFNPGAIADYRGDWTQPVACSLALDAYQLHRPLWKGFLLSRRQLGPIEQKFSLQFHPEAADVKARLAPGIPSVPTGDVGKRKPVDDPKVSFWLAIPHTRRSAEEKRSALAELVLQAGTTARRACSLPCTARLELMMYRADYSKNLDNGVELDERALRKSGGFKVERIQPERGEPYWKISGIAYQEGVEWPVRIPLRFNFDAIALPPFAGDDYIVEARLFPDDGQDWATVTAYYGVQVGPDPRQAELMLEVLTDTRAAGERGRWQALDWHETEELPLKASAVKWTVGTKTKGVLTLLRLRAENLALAGTGRVTLVLEPGATVKPHKDEDPALEPEYRSGRNDLLLVSAHGEKVKLDKLTEPLELSIANEAPKSQRPVHLDLRFDANAITHMERRHRLYSYQCELPFLARVQESADGPVEERRFRIVVDFEVERFTGDHVLAVDFGTSAVVVAFEESRRNIERRDNKGFSLATLNLQTRYMQVLKERDQREIERGLHELGGGLNYEAETKQPNLERRTRFIPSSLTWQPGEKEGDPALVYLPSTMRALRRRKDVKRAIFYIKGLILRGDKTLPRLPDWQDAGDAADEGGSSSSTEKPLTWIDQEDREQTGAPPVDGLLTSAYRNLLQDYVEKILTQNGKADYLNKMVFAHPNNFSLGHIQRLKRILRDAAGDLRVDLLSESDAVAIYCCYRPKRFLPKALTDRRAQNLLVYDIGAGTLDLTYTRLEWGPKSEAFKLKKVEVLFQAGIPVAGNRLDMALAKLIDAKIRQLQAWLGEEGIDLQYTDKIVEPEDSHPSDYMLRMLPIKEAVYQLKVDTAEKAAVGGPFTVHVPLNTSPDLVEGLLSIDVTRDQREVLKALDIRYPDTRKDPNIYIPLTDREIFENPAVERWLSRVTDDVISDLAGALRTMGIDPQIDALIISGRTSQFPPLRPRLEKAIHKELGISPQTLNMPELAPTERKEAVALGCLFYGLFYREGIEFINRRVWARYGLIYETGDGPAFEEFFGFATPMDPHQGDVKKEVEGQQMVLFKRTREIHRSGGQVDIAMTFSQNPQRDVRDAQTLDEKFTIIHTLGSDMLGGMERVSIELSITEDAELKVIVDPDGWANEQPGIAYRSSEYLPQLEWPFWPLKDPLELQGRKPKLKTPRKKTKTPPKGDPSEKTAEKASAPTS